MALLWFDGFESYANWADYNAIVGHNIDGHVTFSTTYGRRGSRGIRTYGGYYFSKEVPGTPSTIIFGMAIQIPSAITPVYSGSTPLFRLYDAVPTGNTHIKIHINSSRLIEVRNGSDALLGTSSGHSIEGYTWYYLEVKVYIHDTNGTIEIKVDGITRLSLTSQDTLNGTNAYVKCVRVNGISGPSALYVDDFYICDNSGAKNNDFLGDVRSDILRPNAAGTYTDFTPSAGSNYQNVDEVYGPDDDTTYNDGANVGDQDSYQMPDLPVPAGTTIYGVKSQITVRKTDAGGMKCKLLTRAGTTDDLGDEIILSDSYVTHAEILEDNPDDAAAWADADVNGMEVGVEITA